MEKNQKKEIKNRTDICVASLDFLANDGSCPYLSWDEKDKLPICENPSFMGRSCPENVDESYWEEYESGFFEPPY